MNEQTITITKSEYDRLNKAELKLLCLEEYGVDNWEGYDEAMSECRKALQPSGENK